MFSNRDIMFLKINIVTTLLGFPYSYIRGPETRNTQAKTLRPCQTSVWQNKCISCAGIEPATANATPVSHSCDQNSRIDKI